MVNLARKPSHSAMSLRLFISIALLWGFAASAQRLALPVERVPFGKEEMVSDLWDASVKSELAIHGARYVSLSPKGIVRECFGDTTDMYLLVGDTLCFRGYTVGRDIGVLTDSAAAIICYPLSAGRSFSSDYTGTGLAFGEVAMACRGHAATDAARRGRFVFAPGDTVDAFMYRESRTEKSVFVTSDTLIWDNVQASTVEIIRWNVFGTILPLALQRRCDGGEWHLFMAKNLPETVFEETILEKPSCQKLLSEAKVSVGATTVDITLGQAPGVVAEAYIVDVSGNIFGRMSRTLDEPSTSFTITTAGLSHGSYMLVIVIEGAVPITEKRMLVI